MPARKPSRLLELTGAYRKNPQRRRGPEPEPSGPLGDPPARMSEPERDLWYELAAIAPAGVLTNADRFCVELACQLMAKATRQTSEDESEKGSISGAELSILGKLLASMGMTPVDRSRLSVAPQKRANAFSDLAAEAEEFKRPN